MLVSSPIISGEEGAPAGFGGGDNDFAFGVDPNVDPELALVRMMEWKSNKSSRY